MKKTVLLLVTALLGLMPLRAQECDTVSVFPWHADFGGGLGCWQQSGPGYWTVANAQAVYGQLNVSSTNYITLTTPALRLDTDSAGLRLWWKDQRNYMYPNLIVIVQKEDGTQDTLYHADMGSSLTQHSVSLAPYVGQTVHIAFNVRLSSSGYTYRATLRDIGIYSQHTPLGSLSAPTLAVVGDTVTAVLNLTQGLAPLNYTWHSVLLGDLVGSDTLRMVYPSSGWDTLTVTASNAYGTLSRSARLRVHECPSVVSFPWREDFDGYDTAAYNVCWTINGWTHRNPGTSIPCYDEDGMYASFSQLMTSSTNGKYMLSPAITIPATGTEHLRLWVQSHNMPTVRISPTASLQPAGFTDTLHVGSSTGNTMVWRLFDLAPYAGLTIRVGLFRQGTSPNVNTIQIDYDTLPVIYADGPAKTATGTSTLLTAHLRHGASEGLHYTWSSQLMGSLTSCPSPSGEGSEVYVTYTVGGEDTITVIATNAFGSDTVRLPLHVVDCTPATVLPWSENFDDGLACWYRPQGSNFENSLHTSINQVHDSILHVPLRYDTLGSWIMSKEIHLPADTALLPRLFWTVGCSRDNYQTLYSLLVTDSYNWTDTTNYTHLITDSAVHTRSLYGAVNGADLMSLDLRPYAGRTIHLAIHNHAGHLSTNITYLNFHSFEIRSTAMPRLTMAVDEWEYYYGDTATFTATLLEGSDSGLVYTWHSTLLDSTIVGDTLLRLCYGLTSGIDTVTVVATNAYGSDSASAVVASSIINEPTVYLVAEGRQYNKVETDDTVVYLATRNRCVTTGMTYLFHSTLLDTTITLATTADTVRLPIVYPVAGIDTFTVTLSNTLDTSLTVPVYMTVLDCSPVSVPFYEDFEDMTISSSPDCWDGLFWVVLNGDSWGKGAYFFDWYNTTMLISPLIDLPADSLGLQISWASDYSFYYNADVPSKVLVSPTGGKRVEDFTDTLYTGALCHNGVGSDSVLLDAYRGSRVRIAFPSMPNTTSLYDNIRIDYNRTAPQVSLDVPAYVNLYDTVLFTATLNGCSPQGLSVSWHSTLLDSSLTPSPSPSGEGSEVQLVYTVVGVDTLTVIVANAYGADTAVAIIHLADCSSQSLPYTEDFEAIAVGSLPACWSNTWTGSNSGYAPRVVDQNSYQVSGTLPGHGLIMVAGANVGYGSEAMAILPHMDDSLQHLSVAFDYRFDVFNQGTLEVGYYNGDTFTALQTMTPQSQTYRRDTVLLNNVVVPDAQIALRWTHGSVWYAVYIDNIEVFQTPASLLAPQVAITAPASVLLTDSATYTVTLNNECSLDGLSFTWHSTLLDSTIVTTESLFTLSYTAGGIDTVTVIASNAYGADTAVAVVRVYDCGNVALPYVEDFESVTAEGWNSAYGNLPDCWSSIAIGASHRPKVVSSYQYMTTFGSQALLIMAGNYSGYADAAYVLLPLFSDSLQRLSVAFDYRCESASYGTLTVGYWNDSLLTFHPVRNLASHAGLLYARDTVSFADVASVPHPTHTHIALKWYCNTSYYGVAVDNLEVFINNGILAPDMLTVENVTATCATLRWSEVDTATAYRVTLSGAMSIDTVLTDTTLTLCSLLDDADYSVRVAPMVGSEAGRSASATFHTLMLCAPLANVSISPEGIISWQYDTLVAEQAPAGVEIEIIDQQGMVLVQTDTAYFSPYVPANLTPGHTYSFAVRTLCTSTTANTADTVVMQVVPSVCVEAASNTIPSNSHFMDNFWEANYSQVIYPASFAAGIDTLYGIALRVAQYEPYSWQTTSGTCRYDIYVGQTNGTHTSPLTSDSLTMVVNNKHYSLSGTGWKNFLFSTPYLYDGTGDLVVTIVSRQSNTVYNPVYGVHTDATCTHFVQDEDHLSEAIDPSTLDFQWETNANIPDIRLLGGCGGSVNTCLAPEVEVAAVDTHSVSLQWQQRGSESLWQVEYRPADSDAWQLADTTGATNYTITGLAQATHYLVRVGSVCSDSLVAYSFPDSATSLCGYMELPYTISFLADEYPCWTLGSNSYHSNWNGVTLSEWNPNGYIISPEVNTNIANLRATITALRPVAESYESRFAVGVCDADGSNVTWIDTIGFLQQYTVETNEVHFNHYTGSGHYIILKGIEGTCYIRQFSLEAFAGCVPVHDVTVDAISEHSAQLAWVPELATNTWAVYLDGTLVATTTTPSCTLTGLTSNTQYTVAVREICGAGDTSTAVTRMFQTLCDAFALPYFEEFDQAPEIGSEHILTDCWVLHADGNYASAYCIGDQWTYTALSFYDNNEGYGVANYLSSPRLTVGSGGATVSFKGQTSYFDTFTVGIMLSPYDTSTFIPVRDITVSSGGMAWYSFSTDTIAGAPTSGTFTVAFRFNGEGSGVIDSLIVEDIPVLTYDLILDVNDTAMGSVSGAGTYEEGTVVTVTATPNPGYRFVMWNDSVTTAIRQVTLRDSNITLIAYFETVPPVPDTVWRTVTVTANVEGAGEPYGSGLYVDSSTVEIGYHVADTATVGGHWQFLGWSDGGEGNPRNILVTSDTAIVALFEWVADTTAGIDDISIFNSQFSIYPNPTSGDATVTVGNSDPRTPNSELSVTVLDMTGRVVIPPTPIHSTFIIHSSELPAGVYFVRVGNTVKKLVVR